ncbi:hypothetical protein [Pareuzebyella sediminis]|uniref:hypothetical protein n=1 Tax=Pareuzebyella sediminis TaxID=2607998 RepID=UPI0011EF18BF|nr:hypothetical protein [Pareuzebyella sediminis]
MKYQDPQKNTWSASRYAWICAIGIIAVMSLLELLFSLDESYENRGVRLLNLVFIIIGFMLMVYRYTNNRSHTVSYLEAFKLCLRAGVYLLILFFPLLALVLEIDPSELVRLKLHMPFANQLTDLEIMGTLFVEMPAFIFISALVSAPISAFAKEKRQLNHQ